MAAQTNGEDKKKNAGQNGNELSPDMQTTAPATSKGDPETKSMYERTMNTLRTAENTTPVFESDYDETIRDLFNRITNREAFKYDYSTDPLFGQYKESYVQSGRQAMRDTMGQTAALTGGYGSSYGSVAGQQTYDAYMSRLNDVIPVLEGQAYNRYQAEGDRLAQQYAFAGDMRDQQYGEFRDALGDWQYAQAAAQQEAYERAGLGDWEKYRELYGEDAARIAQIMTNPQAAYASGAATGEEIYAYTGVYPVGYSPAGGGVSGGYGGASGVNFYSPRESAYGLGFGEAFDALMEQPGMTPVTAWEQLAGTGTRLPGSPRWNG